MPPELLNVLGTGGVAVITIFVLTYCVLRAWDRMGKPFVDSMKEISENFADASANHKEAARESREAADVNQKAAAINQELSERLSSHIERLENRTTREAG